VHGATSGDYVALRAAQGRTFVRRLAGAPRLDMSRSSRPGMVTVVGGFDLGRGVVVQLAVEAVLVDQATHPQVATSRSSRPRHGPPLAVMAAGLRCSSVLNKPMADSASALSKLSPTVPIYGAAPISALGRR